MIIQLRGTSGSGKSHIVRGIKQELIGMARFKEAGRRQPIGYGGTLPSGPYIAIPGHYETPCGGCDTIPDLTKVFDTVRTAALSAKHVLFEGLLASEDTRRTLELREWIHGDQELRIIFIDTPIEACLAGIQLRRDNRGDTKPINPANTTNRVRTIRRACEKLREQGVDVRTTDRDGAAALVREWLS